MKKNVAHVLLWSLLLQTLSPVAVFAHTTKPHNPCGSKNDVAHAHKIKTDTLCVKHDAKVGCDLKVGDDVVIGGDLTVKGNIHGHCPTSCDNVADYIIIGMGTAGAVLAKRLTDDKHTSVIGLEAGDNNGDDQAILDPSRNGVLQAEFFPEYFWQGESEPLPEVDNRSFLWTAGRLLGGSSSINGMQVVRGTPAYWQGIADIAGSAWSVSKVFKRYKKLETYISPFPNNPTRGSHGPWSNIDLPFVPTPDAEYVLAGMEAVTGTSGLQDYNNPATPLGVFNRWNLQERIVNGELFRESAAYAFLNSDVMTPDGIGVHGRKLRVHLRATAINLLWNKDKVIGVRYTQNGECHDVFAKKEVIVCAGFQSAQFLQRNGIGPKDVLEAAGVPVRVANDNVGRHLLNHVYFVALFLAPGAQLQPDLNAAYGNGAFLPQLAGGGSLNGSTRDIQWIILSVPGDIVIFAPLSLKPKSEGTVSIQNDDPFKIPLVDLGYLNNDADFQPFIDAARNFLLDMNDYFAANPAPNGSTWTLLTPTPAEINDDDAMKAFIRANLVQTFHTAGHCRMGTDAATGVVDGHGRVFGVKGLRVADNSILPNVPDANTATPAVLVGWTISDIILAGG